MADREALYRDLATGGETDPQEVAVFDETASTPASAANQARMYARDSGGVSKVFVQDSDGNEAGLNLDVSVLEHVYISQANGSDANDGSSGASALATIGAHIAKYPEPPKTGRVFHFDSGLHTMSVLPKGWGQYAPIIIIGDGADQGGDDGYTEIKAPDTTQGGTTSSVLVTSGGVSSADINKYVEILSGSYTGAFRLIHDVSGNSLTLNRTVPGLTSGVSYRIVEPAALLDFPPTGEVFASGIGSPGTGFGPPSSPFLGLINVQINPSFDAEILGCQVLAYGVFLVAEGLHLSGSTMHMASSQYSSWNDGIISAISQIDPGVPQTTSSLQNLWTGWGVFFDVSSTGQLGGHFISGYLGMPDNAALMVGSSGFSSTFLGTAILFNCRCGVHAYTGGFILVQPQGGDTQPVCLTTNRIPVFADGGTIHIIPPVAGTSLWESSANNAIKSQNGGLILLYRGTYRSTSGIGARTRSGRILFKSAVVIEGSTPGTNDLEVGNGEASVGQATLSVEGDYLSQGLGVIQFVT